MARLPKKANEPKIRKRLYEDINVKTDIKFTSQSPLFLSQAELNQVKSENILERY